MWYMPKERITMAIKELLDEDYGFDVYHYEET
jgi:hypothetical protein